MYLFAALAIAMNVVGYWFSDRIALRASRAQPVPAGQLPEIEAMVEDLAHRARVPLPRLYVIPSEQPNAFATGRNPEHAAVAVTEGLLTQLPAQEVRGVLAHEFAHITNRDILVSSIAAMVAGAISAIANVLQFSMLFGGSDDEDSPFGFIGTLAMIIIAPNLRRCCSSWASRASGNISPTRPARSCSAVPRRWPMRSRAWSGERKALPMRVNPAEASLYAINPLPRQGLARLFMTHPPIAERVRRLRALDAERAVALVA